MIGFLLLLQNNMFQTREHQQWIRLIDIVEVLKGAITKARLVNDHFSQQMPLPDTHVNSHKADTISNCCHHKYWTRLFVNRHLWWHLACSIRGCVYYVRIYLFAPVFTLSNLHMMDYATHSVIFFEWHESCFVPQNMHQISPIRHTSIRVHHLSFK